LISIISFPVLEPPVYCKFNESIVRARATANGTIECYAPPLAEGICSLWVSKNKRDWIGPVYLKYVAYDKYAKVMFDVFVIVLMLCLPCIVVWSVVRGCWMRCRKKKRSDDIPVATEHEIVLEREERRPKRRNVI
jgi:hypothetical protein